MSVKEFVYLIQNHADLHKLGPFLPQNVINVFNLLQNTSVFIKTNHKLCAAARPRMHLNITKGL
jgi:hypothetical protein